MVKNAWSVVVLGEQDPGRGPGGSCAFSFCGVRRRRVVQPRTTGAGGSSIRDRGPGRVAVGRALEGDGAAEGLDDPLADGQAHPGAGHVACGPRPAARRRRRPCRGRCVGMPRPLSAIESRAAAAAGARRRTVTRAPAWPCLAAFSMRLVSSCRARSSLIQATGKRPTTVTSQSGAGPRTSSATDSASASEAHRLRGGLAAADAGQLEQVVDEALHVERVDRDAVEVVLHPRPAAGRRAPAPGRRGSRGRR